MVNFGPHLEMPSKAMADILDVDIPLDVDSYYLWTYFVYFSSTI